MASSVVSFYQRRRMGIDLSPIDKHIVSALSFYKNDCILDGSHIFGSYLKMALNKVYFRCRMKNVP